MNLSTKQALHISRPIFWLAPPLIFFAIIAVTGTQLTPIAILQGFLLSFPLCFVAFGVNDMYDYESDSRNPRKGSIQGAILPKALHKHVMGLSLVCSALLLLSSLATLDIINIAAMTIIISLSYFYSAPPRLKSIPIIDSLANGLGVFSVAVLAFSYNGGSVLPYYIYFLGLCTLAGHMISTIPDAKHDKVAGNTTTAIVLGNRTTALIATIILLYTYLFSGVQLFYVRWLILLATILSFIIVLKPRIALLLSKIMFAGLVITGAALALHMF